MEKTTFLEFDRFDAGFSTKQFAGYTPTVPEYLQKNYWWAYLHPKSVRFFENQAIINLILWGNFSRLRDAALDELGQVISGRTLQVACVYGDFTPKLADRHRADARLDVVDVAPIQLENLRLKTQAQRNVFINCQDASDLAFDAGTFDQVIVFFLLHEIPEKVRISAVREALRVTKAGGKTVFVDYHRPVWKHPHRYIMPPILKNLEPFAMDLWNKEISDWVPNDLPPKEIKKTTYFGGLYQKVVMKR